MVEEEQNNNNNNNNTNHNPNNINNNDTVKDGLKVNQTNITTTPAATRVGHELQEGAEPARDNQVAEAASSGDRPEVKEGVVITPERGVGSPCDMDPMEVVKIPEMATKRSIAEVLSQVVKMEKSSSSSASASEATRTPEAPDIVASTTKGRPRVAAAARRGGSGGHRGSDVATLAILCQHYAQLVHALKVSSGSLHLHMNNK